MNGLYVFCFAAPHFADLNGTGIDGATTLEVRRFSPASAVLAEVPVDQFCGADGERNLEDLAWVAPRALRHQQVLELAMRNGPILPARFGTIFSNPEKLEAFVSCHETAITDFLKRVAGQEEWSVKMWLDRAQARDSLVRSALDRAHDRLRVLPAGRRYIEEQKIRSEADKKLARTLNDSCRTAVEALSSRASSVTERPARGGVESGRELARHWAFLVPQEGFQAFSDCVPRTDQNGIAFELTGPWPPYSFVPALGVEAP